MKINMLRRVASDGKIRSDCALIPESDDEVKALGAIFGKDAHVDEFSSDPKFGASRQCELRISNGCGMVYLLIHGEVHEVPLPANRSLQ